MHIIAIHDIDVVWLYSYGYEVCMLFLSTEYTVIIYAVDQICEIGIFHRYFDNKLSYKLFSLT